MKKEFDARLDELDNVISLAENFLEEAGCSIKVIPQITVCLEELFVNVAHYAYPGSEGKVTIELLSEDGKAYVRLTDSGIPFNPLAKADPDVTLSSEKRKIGGLGIFMVKKMMDNVEYSYENGHNIFTMTKNLTD